MNKYIKQIETNLSLVKEAEDIKKDARETGIIGTLGVGSNLISDHIQNRLGLNGPRVKVPKAPIAERAGSFLKAPGKALGNMVRSEGFKRGLKVGAIGGGVSLLGDYAAIKINKALEKKSMEDNKYLEKISKNVQEYKLKHRNGSLFTDREVARVGSSLNVVTGFTSPGIGTVARYGTHLATGRDLKGSLREEARASLTAGAKSVGYGIAGAGLAGLAGAGIGKLVGNKAMVKFVANKGADLAAKIVNTGAKAARESGADIPPIHVNPKHILDGIAGKFPHKTKAVLSHKHFGAIAGASMGAVGGLAAGGATGYFKGDYDGRLKSIRNQINEGRLANVINTQNKK